MPAIDATSCSSALFGLPDHPFGLRHRVGRGWRQFSAFFRVIDAISSIDADVSSSDAACSVAPCDSDCDELDDLAARTPRCDPCRRGASDTDSRSTPMTPRGW